MVPAIRAGSGFRRQHHTGFSRARRLYRNRGSSIGNAADHGQIAASLIGVDIAPAMVTAARSRLKNRAFVPVAADGQRLPFKDDSFDAAVCQLGLQFFPDPLRGLTEVHRVLRKGCRAAICVISTPDRAPMWGVLADTISRYVPEQRDLLHLSFALSDAGRLERMFLAAGFHDVRIERKEEQDSI